MKTKHTARYSLLAIVVLVVMLGIVTGFTLNVSTSKSVAFASSTVNFGDFTGTFLYNGTESLDYDTNSTGDPLQLTLGTDPGSYISATFTDNETSDPIATDVFYRTWDGLGTDPTDNFHDQTTAAPLHAGQYRKYWHRYGDPTAILASVDFVIQQDICAVTLSEVMFYYTGNPVSVTVSVDPAMENDLRAVLVWDGGQTPTNPGVYHYTITLEQKENFTTYDVRDYRPDPAVGSIEIDKRQLDASFAGTVPYTGLPQCVVTVSYMPQSTTETTMDPSDFAALAATFASLDDVYTKINTCSYEESEPGSGVYDYFEHGEAGSYYFVGIEIKDEYKPYFYLSRIWDDVNDEWNYGYTNFGSIQQYIEKANIPNSVLSLGGASGFGSTFQVGENNYWPAGDDILDRIVFNIESIPGYNQGDVPYIHNDADWQWAPGLIHDDAEASAAGDPFANISTFNPNNDAGIIGDQFTIRVEVDADGNTNYQTSYVYLPVTVGKVKAFIRPATSTLTYNGTAQQPAATIYQYKISDGTTVYPGIIVENATVSQTNVGTYDMVVGFNGNYGDTYEFVADEGARFTIQPATLVPQIAISNDDPDAIVYGTAVVYARDGVDEEDLLGTGEGKKPAQGVFDSVEYRYRPAGGAWSDWAALTNEATQLKNVGEYELRYNFICTGIEVSGDHYVNYVSAGADVASFTIVKKSLVVTANNKTITYGDAPANDGVSYDGFIAGESAANLGGELAYAYNYTQYGDAGYYAITPSGYTSINYDITYNIGELTVDPLEVVIAWDDSDLPGFTGVYDGERHVITATITNIQNNDDVDLEISENGSKNVISNTAVASLTGTKADNYKLSNSNPNRTKAWSITARHVTFTFTHLTDKIYTGSRVDPDFVLNNRVAGQTDDDLRIEWSASTENAGSYNNKNFYIVGNKVGNYQLDEVDGIYTVSATEGTLVNFVIQPKPVNLIWTDVANPVYTGTQKSVYATVDPLGVIGVDSVEVTAYSNEYATNVGNYTAAATNLNNGNYTLVGGTNVTFDWAITNASMYGIDVHQGAPALTYNGDPQQATVTKSAYTVDSSETTFTYCATQDGVYSASVPSFTTAGTHTVYYKINAANHNEESGSFTVLISKANPDMSDVSFFGDYNPYNGSVKTLEVTGSLPDGVTVAYYVTNANHDATNTVFEGQKYFGTYYVEARFTVADLDNFNAVASMYAVLDIQKRTLALDWAGLTPTYDGASHCPTATVTNKQDPNDEVTVTIDSGTCIDAGGYHFYKAVMVLGGAQADNYQISDEEHVPMTIGQREVTVSFEHLSDLVYNGLAQAPTIVLGNVVDGDEVEGVYDNGCGARINASHNSTYLVRVGALTGEDADNYKLPTDAEARQDYFTLNKREVSLIWSNDNLIYNGQSQKPTATVNPACLAEGDEIIEFVVTVIGAQIDANANTVYPSYNAQAQSLSGSDNYKLPDDPPTHEFVINQKEIGLDWESPLALSFTYDGFTHKPIVWSTGIETNDICNVTVTGEQTNAGEYTATVTAISNLNYKLPSSGLTHSFVINPRPITISGTLDAHVDVLYADEDALNDGATDLAGLTYVHISDGSLGTGDTLSEVIALTVGLLDGQEIVPVSDLSEVWDVNNYYLVGVVINDNYDVTFDFVQATDYLAINPRHITVKNVNAEHKTMRFDVDEEYLEWQLWQNLLITDFALDTSSVHQLADGENLAEVIMPVLDWMEDWSSIVGNHNFELTCPNSNYVLDGCVWDENAYFEILPGQFFVRATAAEKTYGDADPTFEYALYAYQWTFNNLSGEYDGALALIDAQDAVNLVAGALGRVAGENVGDYEINLGALAVKEYEQEEPYYFLRFAYELVIANEDKVNLTINPKPITVVYTDEHKTVVYADEDMWDALFDEMEAHNYYLDAELVAGDSIFDVVNVGMEDIHGDPVAPGPALGYGQYYLALLVNGAKAANYNVTIDLGDEAYLEVVKTFATLTAPTAKTGLIYSGQAQALVNAGANVVGGDLQYRLGEGEWVAEVPSATLAGAYVVSWRIVPDENHSAVNGTIEGIGIAKADYDMSGVTFAKVDAVYDGQAHVATISGQLPAGVTVAYAHNSLTNVGSVTATAHFTGDADNYNVIADKTAIISITKAPLTITAENKNATYGDAAPAFTVTYVGFIGDETAEVLGGELAFVCEYAAGANVGEYAIVASGLTADNYEIVFNGGVLTVAPKAITVTAESKSSVYGKAIASLTATVQPGLVAGDAQSAVFTLSTTATITSAPGTYPINVVLVNNANYDVTVVAGVYTITEAAPVQRGEGADAVNVHGKEVTETEAAKGVSVKQIFENANADNAANKAVEIEAGNVTVSFDANAIAAIAGATGDVSLKVVVSEEEGEELVLNITLAGATFADGKATVSVPFAQEVPAGKVVKVYFVDADGSKTDMNATLENGVLSFGTNHFSKYVVEFENAPKSGLGGGAIAGIVIAVIVVLGGVAAAVVIVLMKQGKLGKKAEKQEEPKAEEPQEEPAEQPKETEENAEEPKEE